MHYSGIIYRAYAGKWFVHYILHNLFQFYFKIFLLKISLIASVAFVFTSRNRTKVFETRTKEICSNFCFGTAKRYTKGIWIEKDGLVAMFNSLFLINLQVPQSSVDQMRFLSHTTIISLSLSLIKNHDGVSCSEWYRYCHFF